MISALLFRLARHPVVDPVVHFGFAHASALLPVRRVCETEEIIALHHPRPSWPWHVLFVPKIGIASFLALRPDQAPLVGRLIHRAVATASQVHVEGGASRCWSTAACTRMSASSISTS